MTTPKSHQRRGKTFETDLMKWLREQGHTAERLPLTGTKDEGDLVIIGDQHYVVVECKAPGASNRIDLSGWLKETQQETLNYANARGIPLEKVKGILVIKARGKTISEAYVVQKLGDIYGGAK
jgi:Holliday junction resolvase